MALANIHSSTLFVAPIAPKADRHGAPVRRSYQSRRSRATQPIRVTQKPPDAEKKPKQPRAPPSATPPPPRTETWSELFDDIFDTSGTIRFAQNVNTVQREWAKHRQTRRYVRHIIGLPKSRLVLRLLPVIVFAGLESLAVSAYTHVLGYPVPRLSNMPFGLMSGVVGLLLVFRTNSSFARYWEARAQWGLLVNRCRDFARMTRELLTPESYKKMTKYIAAFPFLLREHLYGGSAEEARTSVSHLLDAKDLDFIEGAKHRPNAISMLMTKVIQEDKRCNEFMRLKMDAAITVLIDVLGASERILRTPIPLSYTRHTSRVCLIWCASMPFVLYKEMGDVGCFFATVVITFVLLGIEDIGVNIEDPFRIMPLTQLANTIEGNVIEIEELGDKMREDDEHAWLNDL